MKRTFFAFLGAACATVALSVNAQELQDNASPQQVAAALKLEGASPEKLASQLCIEGAALKAMTPVRLDKLVSFLGALEAAGLDLRSAFDQSICGFRDLTKPLGYVIGLGSNSEYAILSRLYVPALAKYAKQAGKGDAWLRSILDIKYEEGVSLYDDLANITDQGIREVRDNERAYRKALAAMPAVWKTIFGQDGLGFNETQVEAAFSVPDAHAFASDCMETLTNEEQRRLWLQRLRHFDIGDWQPRGIGEGMVFESVQKCRQALPNFEEKVRQATPAFMAHYDLLYKKKQVGESLEWIDIAMERQPKYCPENVAVVAEKRLCKIDFQALYKRVADMKNNAVSGLTVQELDRLN